MNEALDQLLPGEQILHLGQVGLQFVCVGVVQLIVHAAPPVPFSNVANVANVTICIHAPVRWRNWLKPCALPGIANTSGVRGSH